MRLFIVISFLFSLFSLVPFSSSYAKGLVKVGAVMPHDLGLLDQTRKKRDVSNLVGGKGMVLVFIRSVEWCPFCQKQVIELNKNSKKFKDKGYTVVTVSYDSVLAMSKFLTTHNPTITMLSDPRSQSIRAFGILDEKPVMGTRTYGIPHPGVYIIDKNKKVQAKFFKNGYKNRASVAELLSKIDELNPKPKPKKRVVRYRSLDSMGQDPIIPGEDVIDIPAELLVPVLPAIDTETPSDAGVSLSPDDYSAPSPGD